jgi:hypothetical protein
VLAISRVIGVSSVRRSEPAHVSWNSARRA